MADSSNSFSDASSWNKTPHGLVLGESFKSLTRNLEEFTQQKYHEQDQKISSTEDNKSYYERLKLYIKDAIYGDSGKVKEAGLKYLQNSYLVDTSVGGMDCINPHWQFGVDDDIRHQSMLVGNVEGDSGNKDGESGLGRVYHEMYYLNQKNIYMTFGVPRFYNLAEFLNKSATEDESKTMNNADPSTLTETKELIVDGALAWNASSTTMQYVLKAGQVVRSVLGNESVSKFYGLKPAMPLYYRLVNTIMSIMAVNMNLYPDAETAELIKNETKKNPSADNYPPVLKNGPDIYAILDKRRHGAAKDKVRTTDSIIKLVSKVVLDQNDVGKVEHALDYMGQILSNANDTAHNLFRYIAFRLESGESPSESIGNQTGDSPVTSTINGAASAARDKNFAKNALDSSSSLAARAASGTLKGIQSVVTGTLNAIVGESASEILISGNGYVDIPEVWKSSSFSKTQSFTLQLRARSGDKISIYQSIYIPLAMLMAGAMPRGIGENAYTQPFLLEAYAAGLYSCPMGIIDSLSIKRGKNEFGWTHEDLPTAIDITVSIKDLSPVMFLSLMKPTSNAILNSNTGLLDYLNTLSGMSLADRTFLWERLKRLRKSLFLINKSTVLNPMHYSHRLGDTWLARLGAAVSTQPFFTPTN